MGERKAAGGQISEIALRKQHAQRRLPIFIRVNVGRHLDAAGAGGVKLGQHLLGLAPAIDNAKLEVGDLHRDAGFGADLEDLVDRVVEGDIFGSDMAHVGAAAGLGGAGQRQHFITGRIDAGIIFKPGREPQRAGLQVSRKQRLHGLHFGRSGNALVVCAHHPIAQETVAGVRCDIDGGGPRGEFGGDFGQRRIAVAILANDNRRHPLGQQRLHGTFGIIGAIMVAVTVDEAGGQHQPLGVDHLLAGKRLQGADRDNAILVDAHGDLLGRRARPVMDAGPGDQGGRRSKTVQADPQQQHHCLRQTPVAHVAPVQRQDGCPCPSATKPTPGSQAISGPAVLSMTKGGLPAFTA